MLATKLKGTTKFKSYGKRDILNKHSCDEEQRSYQGKDNFKDYVTEIFAGLSWLG